MTQRHNLKTHPEPFCAVLKGEKLFEVRKDDRNFRVGDILDLMEWVPSYDHHGHYTGRCISACVAYKTPGGQFGLPPDLCVMSLANVTLHAPEDLRRLMDHYAPKKEY